MLKILKIRNVINPCFNRFRERVLSFADFINLDRIYNTKEMSNYANITKSIILQLLRKVAAESILMNILGRFKIYDMNLIFNPLNVLKEVKGERYKFKKLCEPNVK